MKGDKELNTSVSIILSCTSHRERFPCSSLPIAHDSSIISLHYKDIMCEMRDIREGRGGRKRE